MRLRPHVAGAQYRVVSQRALDRQHVLLRVRGLVVVRVVWYPADGFELRPIDRGVGMAGAGVQGRKLHWKILAQILTVGRCNEGCRKQRWSRTGVGGAVRRISAADSN